MNFAVSGGTGLTLLRRNSDLIALTQRPWLVVIHLLFAARDGSYNRKCSRISCSAVGTVLLTRRPQVCLQPCITRGVCKVAIRCNRGGIGCKQRFHRFEICLVSQDTPTVHMHSVNTVTEQCVDSHNILGCIVGKPYHARVVSAIEDDAF